MRWQNLWSDSVLRMFATLQYRSSTPGTTYFPTPELSSLKIDKSKSALSNLIKILPKIGKNLEHVLLNNNLLILCYIDWIKSDTISSFSMQSYVCTRSIEDLYIDTRATLKKGAKAYYYRYDCHPKAIGPIFKEPIFHFHNTNYSSLRTHFPPRNTKNPIMDFIEHIYINHFYSEWLEWVTQICMKKGMSESFKELCNLFNGAAIGRLSQGLCLEEYTKIKKSIYEEKNQFFTWNIEPSLLESFSYWVP